MARIAGGPACDHLGIAVGLGFVNLGLFLQIGRADPAVNIKCLVAPAQSSFCADDPGVVVAEHGAILLESGRIGGDFAQLQVVFRIAGSQQFHAVFAQQVFSGGFHGLDAVFFSAHTGQGAEALGLDEDLSFFAFGRAYLVAVGIVGPEEPCAVPAIPEDGFFHVRNCITDGFCFFFQTDALAQGRIFTAVLDKHAADEYGLCHRSLGRTEGLEGFAGLFGEAV